MAKWLGHSVASSGDHLAQLRAAYGARREPVARRPAPMRFEADPATIAVTDERRDLTPPIDARARRFPARPAMLDHAVFDVDVRHSLARQPPIGVGIWNIPEDECV